MTDEMSTCCAAIAAHVHRSTSISYDVASIVTGYIASDLVIDNVINYTGNQSFPYGIGWNIQSDMSNAWLFIEYEESGLDYGEIIGAVSLDKMSFINACFSTKMRNLLEQCQMPMMTENSCQRIADSVRRMLISSMSRIGDELAP